MYFFRTIGGSLVVLSFDSFVMNLKPLFAGTKKLKNISHLRFIVVAEEIIVNHFKAWRTSSWMCVYGIKKRTKQQVLLETIQD